MTILVKKVFISSKTNIRLLVVPPLCGPFQESHRQSPYKVKDPLYFLQAARSLLIEHKSCYCMKILIRTDSA